MPKSWSFGASIATLTTWIVPGLGIRDSGLDLTIPTGPIHPVFAADVADGAGVDAVAPRAFGSFVHLVLDLARRRLEVVHPSEAVVGVAARDLDAVRKVHGEPRAVTARGRRARDAQLEAALPVRVDL